MVRAPCCEKMGLKKGPWTAEEDQILVSYIETYGHGNWRALPKKAGLLRCGKSCRLRWINYLRPDIKRGNFSPEEEEAIIRLHLEIGNKWSAIASQLPGRTDNEIKNVWHTHLKKRLPQDQASSASAKKTKKAKSVAAAAALPKPASLEAPQPTVTSSSDLSSWSRSDMESTSSSCNYTADELLMDFSSEMEIPLLDDSFWNEALAMDAPQEEQTSLEYTASWDAAETTSASVSYSSGSCSSQETTPPSPARWVALTSNDAPLNGEGDMDYWLRVLIEADNLPEF